MNQRIYSDKFIDDSIAKIDAMHENNRYHVPYPDFLTSESISPFRRKQLDAYIKYRIDTAYVNGFWMGYSLRSGIKN